MKKDFILILDFGSQYTHLIARKIREIGVNATIYPYHTSILYIQSIMPNGIILSGGPFSVYEKNPPLISRSIFQLNIPILGICYGMQLLVFLFGGKILPSKHKEYGKTKFFINNEVNNNLLFHEIPKQSIVWMSHYDEIKQITNNLKIIGYTTSSSISACCNLDQHIYALQFHPEVTHTEFGQVMIKNFVFKICKCIPQLKYNNFFKQFIQKTINQIKTTTKKKNVLLGLSGGIDSYVTAYLLHKSIGSHLYCIFVDTGLLIESETKQIILSCKKINLYIKIIDAKQRFVSILNGVIDPEEKRKLIGQEFINIFQAEAKKIKNIGFIAQGTIYSDMIESSIDPQLTKNMNHVMIKSHHNVGGIPKDVNIKLLEPLKMLFKDEVKQIGEELGISKEILYKHPFPGPGFSIRIIGKVNKKKIDILKKAETILIHELKKANLYQHVDQAFIILLPIKSVGVMGDKRTYEYTAVLRAINTKDFMTSTFAYLPYEFLENISNRIVNEVEGINRIVYDITSKPPSTIEWE
ncbi:glutamine-hydrolyzing GMP synthase [Blattabacterium cuenoti]|uniref:glutamine-hydrolyzing GMP synthase n=1 Tax=Blattabacterium cuenoti TaxID=1653831 RepID=UPI00163CFDCF|nr:glutamine-hydrolyzing GMP synthase [Blattabacterium cuenoti]